MGSIRFSRQVVIGIVIACSGLGQIINPAFASKTPSNITVVSNNGDNFANMVQRGESAAISTIRRSFSRNSRTNQISLIVLGDRNAQKVPMMRISVTRSQWQRKPRIKAWTKYYRDAGKILGFPNNQITAANPSNVPKSKPNNLQVSQTAK
ncbi:hypothetical protein [Brunnivagina elsteri]|uniref:Uncharacterized protein n=1 Tax=Brunnivagina elsteri CCALA 953 TaxID=987040 RepID=A0A2A2TBF8_9CYAN|nr:hypothetical protein [Calothrix elsteri]PAX51127.1 hypothetical protein CK510_26510 [Calothrix elsteri CCALA 953]